MLTASAQFPFPRAVLWSKPTLFIEAALGNAPLYEGKQVVHVVSRTPDAPPMFMPIGLWRCTVDERPAPCGRCAAYELLTALRRCRPTGATAR